MIPYINKIFNLIFSTGHYPKQWASAYIKPLLKKGDPKLPENYRGIAINPSIAKLFNIILNKRIDKFLTDRDCIDSCQIGFSKNARTSDHMFVLKCLIDKYASSNGSKLYSCFIDFKKAFDTVIHPGIRYKLLQLGIGGCFYKIIDNMYLNSTLCIKVGDETTDFFKSSVGVRQGDVLSPNLFKIFVNDIPKYLSGSIDVVELNGKNIDCLLYADDFILFSSSSIGLQQRLNSLSKFCKDWCLDVNVEKTKILIFNKTGRLCNESFDFDNAQLECVQHYRYLGVYFSASGVFSYGIDDIYQKASKASFKITKSTASADPSIQTSINLYDHLIKPIVLYASEIWGIFKTNTARCKKNDDFLLESIYAENIADKSHIRFLKYILGVNKNASNLAVLSETGRYPLYISIVLSIVKYLHGLENGNSELLHHAYVVSKTLHFQGVQTWYSSAMFILKEMQLDISCLRNMTLYQITEVVKRRLIKTFLASWDKKRTEAFISGKLDTYFGIKKAFEREPYLCMSKFSLRKALCKLRISAHQLMIELGRYKKNKLQRDERICKKCDTGNVEDEFHFLFECSNYNIERRDFFTTINSKNILFASMTSKQKFEWLFIQENINVLEDFALFINNCFQKRSAQFIKES